MGIPAAARPPGTLRLGRAGGTLLILAMLLAPWSAMAAPSPSPIPCFKTLKFGGALFLDADIAVPRAEVGQKAGITDPNPAYCGLPAGVSVYAHTGHAATEEVVYYPLPGRPELFRSGGSTGLPMEATVRWLVLALVVAILVFAAVPAILAHVRQPPVEVGNKDDDIYDPPKIDLNDD